MTLFTNFLIMVVSMIRSLLFGKKPSQSEFWILKNFENKMESTRNKYPYTITLYFLLRYRHPPNKPHPFLPENVRLNYIM